ncbi:hypothetical protein ES703_10310 [subsurface metagenome]
MPIKWSAVKVSEAMDEVEAQVILAEVFFAEARAKAKAAQKIPDLPSYMEGRIRRLIDDINRIDYVKGAIQAIRKDIPDGAVEAERDSLKHGSTQSLM